MAKAKKTYARPYVHGGAVSVATAEKALTRIWAEYERRLSSSWDTEAFLTSKNEQAHYFLRREIYALGLAIMAARPANWSTADLVKRLRPSVRRPDKLGDVFHDLLMSVYEDDSYMSKATRYRYASELEYARRHNVAPELLCGFILQSGNQSEIVKKLGSDYIEPAFRDASDLDR